MEIIPKLNSLGVIILKVLIILNLKNVLNLNAVLLAPHFQHEIEIP